MAFEKDDGFKDTSDKIENDEAKDWSLMTSKAIITDPKNEYELDTMWAEWQRMKRYDQRISDMKSIELYGQDNKTRYEEMKRKYLTKDLNDTDPEKEYVPGDGSIQNMDDTDPNEHAPEHDGSTMDIKNTSPDIEYPPPLANLDEAVADDNVKFEDIHYPDSAIETAEKYSFDSMNTVIRPRYTLDQLEVDWYKYNDMSLKRRLVSDDKSIELFGVDNKTHYEFLRSKFIKDDIQDEDPEKEYSPDISSSFIESNCNIIKNTNNKLAIIEAVEKLMLVEDASFTDEILIQNIINNKIDLFDNDSCNDIFVRGDTPFYTPSELEYFGVYSGEANRYSAKPDNDEVDDGIKTSDWFQEYKNSVNGSYSENYTSAWINKLNQLYLDFDRIKESGDVDKINVRKQSILELGWNPNVKFNIKNRMKASDRLTDILNEEYAGTKIFDLSDIVEQCYSGDVLYEYSSIETSVKPLFIVFLKSDTLFNRVITKVTKGPYGHVSLGFDPKLTSLYSFNVRNDGFSNESIKTYHDVTNMKVFCVFLDNRVINKLKANIHHLSHRETGYSLTNLITMPLNIEYKAPNNMVCSQFVDSMLKLAHLDFTRKSSALTTPKDLYNKMYRNKNVYKVFDGPITRYNPNKIYHFLHNISVKSNRIREFATIDKEKYIDICKQRIVPYSTIRETKEFPIQFDDDGNLLIQKRNELDFEAEFAKSHKLLLSYDKTDNYEGMKYELCKLWFMNQQIEAKIFNKKTQKPEVKELHKARAKILNDFNKYLHIICASDKEFNFMTYYNNTPFNDSKIKIKSSTLKYTTKYLKSVILG